MASKTKGSAAISQGKGQAADLYKAGKAGSRTRGAKGSKGGAGGGGGGGEGGGR